MRPTVEGTITFWCRHKHADWAKNENGYDFKGASKGGVEVTAKKNPDKTIQVTFSGPTPQPLIFLRKIPKGNERGLKVAITWSPLAVILYLNGKEAQRATLVEE